MVEPVLGAEPRHALRIELKPVTGPDLADRGRDTLFHSRAFGLRDPTALRAVRPGSGAPAEPPQNTAPSVRLSQVCRERSVADVPGPTTTGSLPPSANCQPTFSVNGECSVRSPSAGPDN